jgi:hypothetical protein
MVYLMSAKQFRIGMIRSNGIISGLIDVKQIDRAEASRIARKGPLRAKAAKPSEDYTYRIGMNLRVPLEGCLETYNSHMLDLKPGDVFLLFTLGAYEVLWAQVTIL